MHTVELLNEAVALADRLGYQVRQEWLGGRGGGGCEIKGRRWMFLDVGLSPSDQLELVLETLRQHPEVGMLAMPQELQTMLQLRRSA